MIRYSQLALIGLSTAMLAGCGAAPAPTQAQTPDSAAQTGQLGQLVEHYWDENAAANPWLAWGATELRFGAAPGGEIAPQSLADSLDLERRYLKAVSAIPAAGLDAGAQLTRELFVRERSLAIEGFTYPAELMPVNPYEGMPQQFALMAPAAQRLALSSAKEFDSWRARTEKFLAWMNQAVANMRDGMRRGYTLPRVLVEKTLPQLAALGDDTPASVFYQAMRANSGVADSAERARLTAEMTAFIHARLLPAYRSLHDFLQHDYLPRARTSVAISALPLGEAWYAYLAKRSTGGTSSPEQLHALGVAEVERVRRRLLTLLSETSFAGDAQGFALYIRRDPRYSLRSGAELSTAYLDLQSRVAAAAPALFGAFPRADFVIRSVDAFRESVSAPLTYAPRAPNGIAAAALYVNTARLDAQPVTDSASLYLREAVPGRHQQRELQFENTGLPSFRRFGALAAFSDGWALYAATLGDELGIYRDAEARFGAVLAELRCAAGLALDTGIHAQGWTRKQAIDYLQAQLPIEDALAEETVDRIVALPADALACTVGFLKIQGLRASMQQKLGARFDVRAFHDAVLKDGALPLDMLESKLKAWADEVSARPVSAPAAPAETAADASAGAISAVSAPGAAASAASAVVAD